MPEMREALSQAWFHLEFQFWITDSKGVYHRGLRFLRGTRFIGRESSDFVTKPFLSRFHSWSRCGASFAPEGPQAGKVDEEISTYQELIARFGDSSSQAGGAGR
jgi:hypothetical protein